MSRGTNEGFMMYFKTITMNLLTVVHLLVEPIVSLAKPKAYLGASFSIRQLPWSVTSSKPAISPSLISFFFFCHMLISNRYWWGTVESHDGRGEVCFNSDHKFYIALLEWKASPLGKWVLLGWTVKCGFKIWQPLHLRLMAYSLSSSDKCSRIWGQHGFLKIGVGCMAKGIAFN